MTERFFNIVNFINQEIGAFNVFVICFFAISLSFLIVFLLSLTVRDYSYSKRKWFVFTSASVCVLDYAILIDEKNKVFFFLLVGVLLLYCSIVFSIRVRKKVNKKQKQLIDYIDSQIRRSSIKNNDVFVSNTPAYSTEPRDEELSESTAKQHFAPIMEEKKRAVDLDFSHVKNVITKLNYYSLSPNDRKQVKDLECALVNAESGTFTPELKDKINDGLGMLLKIMSKYGV